MISTIFEIPLDKNIKNSAIAKKKWWRDVHAVIVRVLRESPRHLENAYDISVILISDERMKELYARYKGKSRVTDVLSFFYGKSGEESHPQGEMFICIPQALRQAKRYRTTPAHEMARLAVHGFLHIYGYDHQKKQQRAVMRSLERVILRICKKENLF